jgi:hypothetical protein
MKYNKSQLFIAAWQKYKRNGKTVKFADCLKQQYNKQLNIELAIKLFGCTMAIIALVYLITYINIVP